MPQVTNRGLVGEMAASPVGQGTVYNAMLKVSATNRERAAKVNSSESQRLEKINKVIDKDVRYTGWLASQNIDKTKNTLKQLAAFQRVLKEDYPAENFSGPRFHAKPIISPEPPKNHTGETSKDSLRKESLTSGSSKKRQPENHSLLNGTKHPNRYRGELMKKKNTTVRFDLDMINRPTDQDQNASGQLQPSSRLHEKEDSARYKHLHDKQSDTDRDFEHKVVNGVCQNNKEQTSVDQQTSQLLREILAPSKPSAASIQNDESESNSTKSKSNEEHNSENMTKHSAGGSVTKSRTEPKQKVSTSNNSVQTGLNSPVPPYEVTAQPSEQISERDRERERRRQERKEMMTQRIFTRGFDKKNLQRDIDAKLALMDPERQRRKVKKQLLTESRDAVDRLISRNKEKFQQEIMRPKKTTQNPADDGHFLSSLPTQDTTMIPNKAEVDLGQSSPSCDRQQEGDKIINSRDELDQSDLTQLTMVNPLLHKVPLF